MVRHFTYLDLTPAQRKKAADRIRGQVRAAHINPFLTVSQRAILNYQLERISLWEQGTLPIGAPLVVPGIDPNN